MKKFSVAFLLSVLFCSFSIKSFSQQDQRIHAAYMIAFGRDASQGEVNYWLTRGDLSINELVAFHKQFLTQDDYTHTSTINQAYIDAMGRNPTQGEIAYWKNGADTYTSLMTNHINWLQGNPDEYANVIRRSYQYVFNRQASQGEINYWSGQGVYSYLMLVGMHQDYQRRNIAKESSSNQVNLRNSSVVAVSLSPAIANEAKLAIGKVGGSNIIAQGGGNIISQGGGNIIAAGGGNIVAAGGGNFH